MTKKCRYNPRHKFTTDEELLIHEKDCPDKQKRTDLKVCPYNNKHVVLTKLYETHIKKCKYRPKELPEKEKKEEKKGDIWNEIDEIFNNNNINKKKDEIDWDINVEKWVDEDETNEEDYKKNKNKIIIQKLKSIGMQDAFDEEDFIFKKCYV